VRERIEFGPVVVERQHDLGRQKAQSTNNSTLSSCAPAAFTMLLSSFFSDQLHIGYPAGHDFGCGQDRMQALLLCWIPAFEHFGLMRQRMTPASSPDGNPGGFHPNRQHGPDRRVT